MAEDRQIMLIECAGTLQAIRKALQDLDATLAGDALPEGAVQDLGLVLTEAMTNIVRHGYPDGTGTISLSLSLSPHAIDCKIIDDGAAFEPAHLGHAPPSPMDLPEGGFGWFIIRQLASQVCYRREGGSNVLRFSMPLRELS